MGRSSNRAGSANGPPAFLWPSPLGARAIRVRVPCCRSWFSLVRGLARSASAHSQALALMTLRASWLPPSQLHTGATVRLCAASGPLLASVIFNGRCERSCPPRALASALAPPRCTLVAAPSVGAPLASEIRPLPLIGAISVLARCGFQQHTELVHAGTIGFRRFAVCPSHTAKTSKHTVFKFAVRGPRQIRDDEFVCF